MTQAPSPETEAIAQIMIMEAMILSTTLQMSGVCHLLLLSLLHSGEDLIMAVCYRKEGMGRRVVPHVCCDVMYVM